MGTLTNEPYTYTVNGENCRVFYKLTKTGKPISAILMDELKSPYVLMAMGNYGLPLMHRKYIE